MNETHTYPDGSQRVGVPPFPKRSPLEEARGVPDPDLPAEQQEPERRKPGRPKKAEQQEP